jgi:hypothetical protein
MQKISIFLNDKYRPMPKTISRRRNTIFISAILLTVFLFSYYFFAYVPEREREMNERGIRVINRMEKNLKERIDHYDRSLPMFKCDYIVHDIINQGRDNDAFETIWNIWTTDSCGNIRTKISEYVDSLDNPATLQWNEEEFYGKVIQYIKKDVKRDQRVELVDSGQFKHYPYIYKLSAENGLVVSANDLIKDIERFEFFEDIIISIPGINQVFDDSRLGLEYFEFKPNAPAKDDQTADLNGITFDKKDEYYKIPSVEVVQRKIGGEDYLCFTRVFWLQNHPYYLTGLISMDTYKSRSRYVSLWVIMISVVFLLFLVQILPVIKPFILSKKERLNVMDVMWSALALVFGVAALGLFVIGVDTFALEEVDLVDEKLQRYAKRITGDLREEVISAVANIQSVEHRVVNPDSFPSIEKEIVTLGRQIDTLKLKVSCIQQDSSYANFGDTALMRIHERNCDSLQVIVDSLNITDDSGIRYLEIDQSGEAFYYRMKKGRVEKIQTAKLNLSHRKYFKIYQEGSEWTYRLDPQNETTKRFYIESIFSLSSGSYETVVAIPDPDTSLIWAQVSEFNSVNKAMLETNYSFAIIDQEGNIHYHSDKTKIHNENYIAESDNNEKLIAFLRNKSSNQLDITFALKDLRVHIEPISGTPWYILTQYDIKRSRLTVTSSMTQTFILVLAVMLYLFVLHVVYKLLMTRSLKGSTGFMYLFLNPVLIHKKYYLWLTVANVFVVGLLGALYKINTTNILLNFLFFLAALTALITLSFAVLSRANPLKYQVDSFMRGRWRYAEWVMAALTVIWIIAAYSVSSSGMVVTTISILLFALVIIALLVPLFVKEDTGDEKSKTRIKRYTWSYINTTSWVILLSIIPGLMFFKTVYNEQHIKRAKSHLIQSYQETRLAEGRAQMYVDLFDAEIESFSEFEFQPVSVAFSELLTPSFSDEAKSLPGQLRSKGIQIDVRKSERKAPVLFCDAKMASYPCFHLQLLHVDDYVQTNNLPIETSIVAFSLPSVLNSKGRISAVLFWALVVLGIFFLYGLVTTLSQRFFYLNLLRRLRAMTGAESSAKLPRYPDEDWVEHELAAIATATDLSEYLPVLSQFQANLEADKKSGLRSDDKEQVVVEEIARLAKEKYDEIWKGLSEEEKLILFDLAQDGLVNSKNETVIFDLTKKGLIKPYPILSPINLSFGFYINYLISSEEAVELEVAAKKDGMWATYKYLAIFLIVVIIIFLSLAEKEAIARITGIISLTAAVFPGVVRTLSTLGSSAKFFNKG